MLILFLMEMYYIVVKRNFLDLIRKNNKSTCLKNDKLPILKGNKKLEKKYKKIGNYNSDRNNENNNNID